MDFAQIIGQLSIPCCDDEDPSFSEQFQIFKKNAVKSLETLSSHLEELKSLEHNILCSLVFVLSKLTGIPSFSAGSLPKENEYQDFQVTGDGWLTEELTSTVLKLLDAVSTSSICSHILSTVLPPYFTRKYPHRGIGNSSIALGAEFTEKGEGYKAAEARGIDGTLCWLAHYMDTDTEGLRLFFPPLLQMLGDFELDWRIRGTLALEALLRRMQTGSEKQQDFVRGWIIRRGYEELLESILFISLSFFSPSDKNASETQTPLLLLKVALSTHLHLINFLRPTLTEKSHGSHARLLADSCFRLEGANFEGRWWINRIALNNAEVIVRDGLGVTVLRFLPILVPIILAPMETHYSFPLHPRSTSTLLALQSAAIKLLDVILQVLKPLEETPLGLEKYKASFLMATAQAWISMGDLGQEGEENRLSLKQVV
ncbi:hypothetical protein BT69DRAFT_1352270, partial [Atractiella rhizophila]